VQGLLANYEVLHWRLSPRVILNNIPLKANLLAGGIFHKGDFNVSHPVSINGAIGSAPQLRDSPLHNGDVFGEPFLYKKEVPT
jgi:hypothetical protein